MSPGPNAFRLGRRNRTWPRHPVRPPQRSPTQHRTSYPEGRERPAIAPQMKVTMTSPQFALSAALLIATGSGCAPTAPTPPPTSAGARSTSAAASPTEITTTSAGSTYPVHRCPPHDDRIIEITAGAVTCTEAYATAARYDLKGEKYQHIEAYTCYTGTAQTAPILLVCLSGPTEFAVLHR